MGHEKKILYPKGYLENPASDPRDLSVLELWKRGADSEVLQQAPAGWHSKKWRAAILKLPSLPIKERAMEKRRS